MTSTAPSSVVVVLMLTIVLHGQAPKCGRTDASKTPPLPIDERSCINFQVRTHTGGLQCSRTHHHPVEQSSCASSVWLRVERCVSHVDGNQGAPNDYSSLPVPPSGSIHTCTSRQGVRLKLRSHRATLESLVLSWHGASTRAQAPGPTSTMRQPLPVLPFSSARELISRSGVNPAYQTRDVCQRCMSSTPRVHWLALANADTGGRGHRPRRGCTSLAPRNLVRNFVRHAEGGRMGDVQRTEAGCG